jgi:hypothetical protein
VGFFAVGLVAAEGFFAGARVAGGFVVGGFLAGALAAADVVGDAVPDSSVAGGLVGAVGEPVPVGCPTGVDVVAVLAAAFVAAVAADLVVAVAASLVERDLSGDRVPPEGAGAPELDAAAARRVDAGSGSKVRAALGLGVLGVGEPGCGAADRARARVEPGIGRRGSSRSWITGATILMTSSSLADASGSRRTPYLMVATPMR